MSCCLLVLPCPREDYTRWRQPLILCLRRWEAIPELKQAGLIGSIVTWEIRSLAKPRAYPWISCRLHTPPAVSRCLCRPRSSSACS